MEECAKSNTSLWVFFTVFKLFKLYQIAQRITYNKNKRDFDTTWKCFECDGTSFIITTENWLY